MKIILEIQNDDNMPISIGKKDMEIKNNLDDDLNSGDRNSGNRNSGDWNSGDRNSGFFNSNSPYIRMFNKDIKILLQNLDWDMFPEFLYFSLTKWIYEADMTEEEKTKYPSSHVTGGYLKTYKYREAFRKAWDNAPESERRKVLQLPNFDPDIFEEISGIDVRKEFKKEE